MNTRHPEANKYLGLFKNLTSYAELDARIAAHPTKKAQGDAFEVFVEGYLATKWQNEFKTIWPEKAIPYRLRTDLNIPEDFGIDGVCLNQTGTYDAYQAKWRGPGHILNYTEVATFYGQADSPKIQSKFLITNCYEVSDRIKERNGAVFILGAHLEQLGAEDFAQIEAWLEGGKIATVKKELRPDQVEAVTALNAELAIADRASCIMACGTGKTFVALKTLEARWANGESQKTIVFVPSLALLTQILSDWRNEGAVFKSLCVCSDQTVDDDIKPVDLGFRVTHEAEKVRQFWDSADDLPKIVFSTYQSSPVIKEAGASFDLGIFDEAHRTAGREGTAFSLPLDKKEISINKRLFFTATPRHCTPAQRTGEGEFVELYNMNNPAQYGRKVHTLSVRKAIELDIIAPYKVLVSVVTSDEVHHELLKLGEVLVEATSVRARHVANQIALRDAIQQHGIKKVFTFHSRVTSAVEFVSKGDEGIGTHLDGFVCESVNGEMSAKVRNDILKDFKAADQAILSNARCLTEGVNVPSVDCVALLAPLKSKVSIAQAMGRALRKSDGKDFGYILVPVYVESDEDPETAAKRSKFDVVLDVLQTLKEQDEALAEELRLIVARKIKGHDDTRGLRDVIFREPAIAPDVQLAELMEAIRVQCIDALLSEWELRWQEQYQRTLRRHEETGNCHAPNSESLGEWQGTQRSYYKKGLLVPHRLKMLSEIPGWAWDGKEAVWQENYQKTVRLHEETGDYHANRSEDRALSQWQSVQREYYKKGLLVPHRVKLLSEIPGWAWDQKEDAWQDSYQKTVSLHKETGNYFVSRDKDLALYRWQIKQRAHYKKGQLAQDRVQLLNEIPGWTWDAEEAAWQENYQKTVRLHKETGDCRATRGKDPLGAWQTGQRVNYKKGQLAQDRVQLLSEIPGWTWDANEAAWQENYQKTVRLHKETGDCHAGRSEDLALIGWQTNQRAYYKKGQLAQNRVQLLSAIPTWSWDRTAFSRGLATLQKVA